MYSVLRKLPVMFSFGPGQSHIAFVLMCHNLIIEPHTSTLVGQVR